MIGHSLRTYYFSAILREREGLDSADLETLYVAAALRDVGLFDEERPASEHCFTVASARVARRIAREAGWDEARADRMAMAITSNLNPSVSIDESGPEAYILRKGGLVEVMAQEWKVNPENLAEIL